MLTPRTRTQGRKAAFSATVAVILISLAGCYFLPKEPKVLAPPLMSAPQVTYNLVEAKQGTIENDVVVMGTFVPMDLTRLYFRYGGGRLKNISVKYGDSVKAGTLIAELDTGNLENRIEQQKLLVRKAELMAQKVALLNNNKIDKEMASIDVQLATLQLQDLQSELDQSRLFSPRSGVVVYVVNAQEGEHVDGYTTVAQVADPKNLQLQYQGDKVSSFRQGMKVSVRINDRNYQGEITLTPVSMPADAPDSMRNSVLVKVTSPPSTVARGDLATITMVLERKSNTIIVPRDVVDSYLGRSFVMVLANGLREERTVETGIRTATEVEIVKGLNVGEKVIMR